MNVAFDQPLTSILHGRVIARGLGYTQDRLKIRDAEVRGDLQLTRDRLTLRQMTAKVMGANIAGQANLEHGQQFHVEGTIDGLDLRRAASILTDRPVAWSGTMAGTFSTDATVGQRDAMARANLSIVPAPGGTPVDGHLDVAYDQAAGTIALGSSSLRHSGHARRGFRHAGENAAGAAAVDRLERSAAGAGHGGGESAVRDSAEAAQRQRDRGRIGDRAAGRSTVHRAR